MESLQLNLISLVSFVVIFIVESLFSHELNNAGGFQKLLSRYQSFVESQLGGFNDLKSEVAENKQECEFFNQSACTSSCKTDEEVIRREDIEIVMEKLDLLCTPNDEKLKMSSSEISNLFEDKEPSLEELKKAFDVFDENKDGFVDAEELQRVLRILGLKEGLDIQNCRMMIGAFDTSRDDRIDFNEFVKVMENGFC